MTPDERMTVRIAAHLNHLPVEELYGLLQDIVQHVQEMPEFPDDISAALQEDLKRAKAMLALLSQFAKGVQ